MIIYIDLLIILNFIFDFLILYIINKILKRNSKYIRLIIASLIGEISILFLIFSNYIALIICKIILAILINIISFKYKGIKYLILNISYFYMLSIILGGFIYFLKINNINYFISITISPIIIFIYEYHIKKFKTKYSNYYNVVIKLSNNHKINTTGYLDTGNILVEPITNKPIIIINKKLIKGLKKIKDPIYVPIKVVNDIKILTCIKPKYILVNNNKYEKVYIGLSDDSINIVGIDCLLNIKLWEDI